MRQVGLRECGFGVPKGVGFGTAVFTAQLINPKGKNILKVDHRHRAER
jgi:hypothetical protein